MGNSTEPPKNTNLNNNPIQDILTEFKAKNLTAQLIEKCDVTKYYNGYTLLHYACMYNFHEIISALIQKGVDIEAKGYDINDRDIPLMYFHETPLVTAIKYKNLEAATLLIKNGSNVNAKVIYDKTPLHYSVWSKEMISILLEAGADIDAVTNNGYTPLIYFTGHGKLEPIELLLQHGAKIDESTNEGETAVHYACRVTHIDVVKLLIRYGADITLKTIYGKNCMDIAIDYNRTHIVEYLKTLQ